MKGSSKCDSFQLLSTLGLPLPVAPHGSVMHEVDSSKRSLEIVCVNAARAPRCPDAVWHDDEGINRYYSILCGNIYAARLQHGGAKNPIECRGSSAKLHTLPREKW